MGGVIGGFGYAHHNPCGDNGKRFSVLYQAMLYPVYRYPQVRYGIWVADTVALAFVPPYSLDTLDESRQPSIASSFPFISFNSLHTISAPLNIFSISSHVPEIKFDNYFVI